jgi:hypothetical protein
MLCGHFHHAQHLPTRKTLLRPQKKKKMTKRKQDFPFNRTAHSGQRQWWNDVFYFRHSACFWMWRGVLWCNIFFMMISFQMGMDKSRQDIHRFLTLYP